MKPNKKPSVMSDALPTQYELTSLAAILKRPSSPNFHIRSLSEENSRLVESALDLWHEAGKILDTGSHSHKVSRYRLKKIGKFAESILVGRHLLPAIPESFLLDGHCDLDEFLSIAVGLSERTDRFRWFRAFLAGWNDPNLSETNPVVTYADGTVVYPSFFKTTQNELPPSLTGVWVRKHPIDPFGMYESKEITIPELLESFRIDGVERPLAMTAAFRAWRLTMKTSEKKAEKPYDLDLCIALAKAR